MKTFVTSLALIIALAVPGFVSAEQIRGEELLGRLAPKETQRYTEIIRGVMSGGDDYLSEPIRREFWSIFCLFASMDNSSCTVELKTEITSLLKEMVTFITPLQKMFWQDALDSYRAKRPIRSILREKLEKEYLNKGLITDSRVQQNKSLIEKIANREPIGTASGDILFDESMIHAVLSNAENLEARLNWLFDPTTE